MSAKSEKKNKHKIRINTKAVIIFLVVLAAAAAIVYAAFVALKKHESTKIAEKAFYYAIDEKEEIPAGSVLSRKDDVTSVENNGHEYSLSGNMIYENGGSVMLFQTDMLWYDRNTDSMKKIGYFNRMSREGSSFTVTRGNAKKEVSGGFLYDNSDMYVLLEDAKLTYGDTTQDIMAGAVISCALSGDVQLIQADGSCTYLEQTGADLSVSFTDGCVLNPIADTYYQANGTWRILYTSTSMVPEL